MSPLRNFSEIHIDEDCSNIRGEHENALFFNCKFNKLNGVTLKNCDLNKSTFETSGPMDAKGFTITLDCFSFNGITLSPELFDLYLLMLCQTMGNDEKRESLKQIIGVDKFSIYKRLLRQI